MNTRSVRKLALAAILGALSLAHGGAQTQQQGTRQRTDSRSDSTPQVITERAAGIPTSGMFGSVSSGEAVTSEVLKLSLADVLDRGLRFNLALAESSEDERIRRAQRLRSLSELLPELTVRPSVTGQQINLAAFGFTAFAGTPQVVGPFAVTDLRANLSETLLDLRKRRNLQADRENERVTALLGTDLRAKVAVFIGGLYLQALTARARVETQRVQLSTARSVLQQATDRHDAGTVPHIDVLRAQVEASEEENRLIAFEGDYDKRILDMARAIGLSPAQPIQLTDSMPNDPLPADVTMESTLQAAYAQRPDYAAAQAAVHAAELARSAAQAGRYPTADLEANYGVIGPAVNQLHGTFGISAGATIPIFQGGRTRAEVEAAGAVLRQRKAELDDLRGKIDADVRRAFTDLRSSAQQVDVARKAIGLAKEQLEEAQSRFSAGVTNSLEVVQAQQATAVANENYISALYSLNVARSAYLLARGDADRAIRDFLRRNKP